MTLTLTLKLIWLTDSSNTLNQKDTDEYNYTNHLFASFKFYGGLFQPRLAKALDQTDTGLWWCLHALPSCFGLRLLDVSTWTKERSLWESLYTADLKNTIENFTSRCHSYALHAHDDKPVEARPQQNPAQWALNVCWAKEVLTGRSPFCGQWQVMKSVRSTMRKRTSLLVHYISACYDIISMKQRPFTAICLRTRCHEQKEGCGKEEDETDMH